MIKETEIHGLEFTLNRIYLCVEEVVFPVTVGFPDPRHRTSDRSPSVPRGNFHIAGFYEYFLNLFIII